MQRSPSSSSRRRNSMHSGTRLRKKQKRLDAICENEYNRNHGETNRGIGSAGAGNELHRSLQVPRRPIVLDASPSPAKKRQKIGKNDGGNVILENVEKEEDRELGDSETPGGWRMRLRSRGRNVRTGLSSERTKHFEEISEINGKKGELEVAIPTMVRSKRPRKIIATDGEEEINMGNEIEQNERNEVDVKGNKDEVEDFASKDKENMIGSKYDEATQSSEREMSGGNEEGIVDDGKEVSHCLQVDEGCFGDDNRETVKLQSDEKVEHSCGKKDENKERIDEKSLGTRS